MRSLFEDNAFRIRACCEEEANASRRRPALASYHVSAYTHAESHKGKNIGASCQIQTAQSPRAPTATRPSAHRVSAHYHGCRVTHDRLQDEEEAERRQSPPAWTKNIAATTARKFLKTPVYWQRQTEDQSLVDVRHFCVKAFSDGGRVQYN